MNLSQAIYYRSYPAAVCCLQICAPYSSVRLRTLAHVVRQGGQIVLVDGRLWQVPPWWIVGIDHIDFRDGLYYARHYQDDTKSYSTLDGCYQWLKRHKISAHSGWYPAGNPQRWIDLGVQS